MVPRCIAVSVPDVPSRRPRLEMPGPAVACCRDVHDGWSVFYVPNTNVSCTFPVAHGAFLLMPKPSLTHVHLSLSLNALVRRTLHTRTFTFASLFFPLFKAFVKYQGESGTKKHKNPNRHDQYYRHTSPITYVRSSLGYASAPHTQRGRGGRMFTLSTNIQAHYVRDSCMGENTLRPCRIA